MRKITHIVLHHSISPDGRDALDVDNIRRYHMVEKGWHDVGYHFLVELVEGGAEVILGRALREAGAHCKELNMNAHSIGICVIGNFDGEHPSPTLWGKALDLCRDYLDAFGIPVDNVLGHREVGMLAGFDWSKGQFKTCPGIQFDMDAFRTELRTGGDFRIVSPLTPVNARG